MEAMVNISCLEALGVLQVRSKVSVREIRLKYMMLARKYHLDKWYERYTFGREEGIIIFKNIANALNCVYN